MTRKPHAFLQMLIDALRNPAQALDRALAARKTHREPDADVDKTEQPDVELPAGEQPAKAKAKPWKKRSRSAAPTSGIKPAVPNCPHCKKPMVIKVARTGKNAGEFWGCEAYPKCRGIRPIFRKPSAMP